MSSGIDKTVIVRHKTDGSVLWRTRSPVGATRQSLRLLRFARNDERVLATAFILFLFPLPTSSAAPVTLSHVETELVSEEAMIAQGSPFWVAIRFKPEPGWHIYFKNPGDAGLAPAVKWSLHIGSQVGRLQWPYPKKFPYPTQMTYGYEEEVLLPAQIFPPMMKEGDRYDVQSTVRYLACSSECVAGEVKHEISLPVASESLKDSAWQARFEESRKRLGLPAFQGRIETDYSQSHLWIRVLPETGNVLSFQEIYFYPYSRDLIYHPARQKLKRLENGYELKVERSGRPQKEALEVEGILVADKPWDKEGHLALAVRSQPKKRKDFLSLFIF